MKQLLILVFVAFSSISFAQDVTLIKGETVEYLKKKTKEYEGFFCMSARDWLILKDVDLRK